MSHTCYINKQPTTIFPGAVEILGGFSHFSTGGKQVHDVRVLPQVKCRSTLLIIFFFPLIPQVKSTSRQVAVKEHQVEICLQQPPKQVDQVIRAASRSTRASRKKAIVALLTSRLEQLMERQTTTHKTAAASQCKLENRMKGMVDRCRFLREHRIPATLVRRGVSFFFLSSFTIALS